MNRSLSTYIDHTLLRPEATRSDIDKLCNEAIEHAFAAVCVLPTWVNVAAQHLKDSSCTLCSVVGFPLGANLTVIKAKEASLLVEQGVHEIDMVIQVGALKSGLYAEVHNDIVQVVKASQGAIVKVIIEACLLTDDEKKRACLIAVDAGAHFVKTSTGFSKSGATIHDVALMRSVVGASVGVKASGGIRDLTTTQEMIQAGANRIGTSSGVLILKEYLSCDVSNNSRCDSPY